MISSRPISGFMISFLMGASLTACRPSAHDGGKAEITIGDQMGLSRSKTEQIKSMAGAPFAFQWANFVSGQSLFEAMNAGAVDVGAAADAPFVLAAAAHAPIKLVAAMRTPGDGIALLVPGHSSLRTVADLKGHHVVVSAARGSIAQYLLLEALRRQHIAPSDVSVSFMPPGDAAAAFGAGQIDAWATFGSYQAIAETQGARDLVNGKGISPGIVVFAASNEALANPAKRAAIADYLRRQARANAWSHRHPDAYAKLYAHQTGVAPKVAAMIAERENPEIIPVDHKLVADLQTVADRFAEFGVLPARAEIAPLVDTSVYPAKGS